MNTLTEIEDGIRTAPRRPRDAGLHQLFEVSPVALVVCGVDAATVLRGNRRARELFGVTAGRLIHDVWVEPADRRRFIDAVDARGSVRELSVRLRSASGRVFWAELDAQRLEYDGAPALLVSIHDRTRQRAREDELRELALRDPLTGAFNRRHLVERGARELARAARYAHPLALALADVDHFKAINDVHGHATGDRALRRLVETCQQTLRGSDVVARYGGEELAFLFVETALAVAQRACERVRGAVEAMAIDAPDGAPDGAPVRVTISVGVVEWDRVESLEALLRRADAHLYAAKAAGRNRVHGR